MINALFEFDRFVQHPFQKRMLLNYCHEYDRMKRQQNGEVVHDDAKRYKQLKAMEPDIDRMYAEGSIKEAKYREYKATLKHCAELLGEGEESGW